jgi:hypothetical protein
MSWTRYVAIDWPSQNSLYGSANHRATRARIKRLRDGAEASFRHGFSECPPATGKRRVTWERILGPRQREFDEPNLIGGLKPLLDGMVRAGLLVDDSPRWYEGVYRQVTGNRQDGPAIRVTIEEVDND